jgi:uncharacterized protein YegJ (DUF2314 family)
LRYSEYNYPKAFFSQYNFTLDRRRENRHLQDIITRSDSGRNMFKHPMKNQSILFSVLALLLMICSCRQDPETLVRGGYDEQEMEAAIARARAEIEDFVIALEQNAGSDFAVKAPIKDRGQSEHFWLTDVSYRDGSFTGLIGNEPGLVSNVKLGQKWTLKKAEISDWMFIRDEKMHGNYTIRPLLKTMNAADAQQWRAMFAEP